MTNTIALNHSAKEKRQRKAGHFSFSLLIVAVNAAFSCKCDLEQHQSCLILSEGLLHESF